MIECMRTEATRKTVTEQRWIPVKYHELTEEERKECLFSADIKYMIDCELPDDEQEIIVTDGRYVWVDTCIVNENVMPGTRNEKRTEGAQENEKRK